MDFAKEFCKNYLENQAHELKISEAALSTSNEKFLIHSIQEIRHVIAFVKFNDWFWCFANFHHIWTNWKIVERSLHVILTHFCINWMKKCYPLSVAKQNYVYYSITTINFIFNSMFYVDESSRIPSYGLLSAMKINDSHAWKPRINQEFIKI